MKRNHLVALVALASLVFAGHADAQIFRRACPTGTCPTGYRRAASVNYSRGYSSTYALTSAPPPCEQVTTVPFHEEQTTIEPCAPIETVEPCAPVETCAPVEYTPGYDCDSHVDYSATASCPTGVCPIRATAKKAITTAAAPIQAATATARFLLAANRVRATYGLPALRASADLDAGCSSQANYCASTGTLTHGAGVAEILAQNNSGFDAALIQWINSPAHRSLLLSSSYTTAGVAVVKDSAGRAWCAMRFR